MEWYVLYTKPKWEIRVAQNLQKLGMEAFCPTTVEMRQWSDRKKKVTTPLFKSYVFIKLREKQRKDVFQVPGVLRYLFWLNKPAIVQQEEIETIKNWLKNDTVEKVEIGNLSPGDKLTIANGNFKGKEATIAQVGKKRLRLILKSLNCVVNVKVRDVKL